MPIFEGVRDTVNKLFRPVTWSLISQDDGTEIEGDYPAMNVTENIEADWAEQDTIGRDQPILQFVGGKLDTVTLELRVWAKHRGILGRGLQGDDIEARVEQLRSLPRRDPDFGRPHVWLFSIGTQFSKRVVVRSVGNISYDRVRSDGSLRGATFSITFLRYEPFSATALAEGESLVTPARSGESYEHIAQRVLGDPILGEALRRRNPDRRVLAVNDLVHVPSRRILRDEINPLTPQSLPLRTGDAQRANLIEAFRDRGQATVSHVLLEDWD